MSDNLGSDGFYGIWVGFWVWQESVQVVGAIFYGKDWEVIFDLCPNTPRQPRIHTPINKHNPRIVLKIPPRIISPKFPKHKVKIRLQPLVLLAYFCLFIIVVFWQFFVWE